jgi:putative hydrolase of the HAD superfamily
MKGTDMIRNVIFDFGQVMIRFDGDIMTAPYVAEEDRAAVRDVVFDRKYFDALDVGAMTDEEAKADYRRRLPERLWESADLVYDNWIRNLPPIEGMAELVRDLKKAGYSVYLLSNISRYFSSHKEANPVLFEFRDWVFSAEVGLVKPDPAIFRLAVEKFGVVPKETLFVDDNAKNLEGAASVGLSTYLFDGNADRLRAALLA